MQWNPMPPYFYVRILKKEQIERKEKLGMFYLSPSHVFMTRACQHAEVIGVGEDAHVAFPEVEIGDTLIIHHFIESKQAEGTDEGKYCIHSDDEHNYYIVTCFSYEGRRNECYGVYKNGEIIPHPEFIFLEDDKPIEKIPASELHYKGVKQVGSLFLFNNWKESREDKGEKMKRLKYENQELARTTKRDENGKEYMPDEVKVKIEMNEREMDNISKDVNKKEYVPFKVEWSNATLANQLGEEIKKGDTVYVLNQAAQTKIEFNNVTYRVANIKYICATDRWLGESLKKYKSLNKELA